MPRRLSIALAGAALVVTACSGSHPRAEAPIAATSTTSPADACAAPPSTTTVRIAVICNVTFSPGDALYVEVHPSAHPIELEVAQPGFEVCPGETEYSAFKACMPIDVQRGATLPSTGTDTLHIGWEIRRADRAAARLASLRVTYGAVDRHFLVRPPASAATTMIVGFTPVASDLIGASAYAQDFAKTDVTVTCTQGTRVLPTAPVTHGDVEGNEACTGAMLGAVTHAQLDGSGTPRPGLQMLLEWK